jgi:hypothetical protein
VVLPAHTGNGGGMSQCGEIGQGRQQAGKWGVLARPASRPNGGRPCGGRGKAKMLTGVEGFSSRPVRKIVLLGG